MACGIGRSCGSAAQCKTVCGPQGCKKSCSSGGGQPTTAPQGGAQGAGQVGPEQIIGAILQLLTQAIGGQGQQPAQ